MILDLIKSLSIGVIGLGIGIHLIRLTRRLKSGKCTCKQNETKTVIITGATSGIGKHCALQLASKNCRIILGCRNAYLGKLVANQILDISKSASVEVVPLDLTSLESVKNFANVVCKEKIDVIINNAGVMMDHFRMTPSSQMEEDMTVNYLAQMYLTYLLLHQPMLMQGDKNNWPRLVFIASSTAKRGKLDLNKPDFSYDPYRPMQAYRNSKLALCLFTRQLKLVHPNLEVITMFTNGMVHTRLARHILAGYSFLIRPLLQFISWLLLKEPTSACQPVIHAALSEEYHQIATMNDSLLLAGFNTQKWPEEIDKAKEELGEELWQTSCQILQIDWPLKTVEN